MKLTTQPTLFRSQHGDVLAYYDRCSNKANLMREALVYYVRNVVPATQNTAPVAAPVAPLKLLPPKKPEQSGGNEKDVQTMEAAFGGMFRKRS